MTTHHRNRGLIGCCLLAASLVLGLTAGGCSKGGAAADGETKKMAGLCKAASDLVRGGELKDDELFKKTMANRLTACSKACDGKDQPSCGELDDQVSKLCSVSESVCSALCDPSKPGSLTDAACKLAKK